MTAEKILEIARGEIGTKESPAGSNREIWVQIENAAPGWEVSDMGRLRHPFQRADFSDIGRNNGNGYLYTKIRLKDGTSSNFLVHRLVAMSFLSNPNHLVEVNHKNGDKKDNRAINLEWVTRTENCRHAYMMGLHKRKLSKSDIEYIRNSNEKQSSIADFFGVNQTLISAIRRNKIYNF